MIASAMGEIKVKLRLAGSAHPQAEVTDTEMEAKAGFDVDSLLKDIRGKTGERDPDKIQRRKPPTRGLCRRCGQNKPVNRLLLCYPCWVKTELEERALWREGTAHPDWCRCEGLQDHPRRSSGN